MKAWRNLAKLPGELWILCLATLVNRTGTMVLPFLVLYLTRIIGFSAERAAVLLGIYGMVGLLMAPTAGMLADHLGQLRMMETALIAFAAVVLLFPLAHSFTAVLLMTIALAATNEAFRPANLSVVGELGNSVHRKSAFTLHRFAGNLGMSIGPAVGGILAQSSFRLLFVVDGLSTLVAVSILIFSPFHRLMTAREAHVRQQRRAESQTRKWPLEAFYRDRTLRVFVLGVLPVLMVFWHLQSPLPLFLVRDLGFSEAAYGLAFTLNTLMIITIEIPLTAAIAHWPHRRALVLGSCLFAIGFGSLTFARTYMEVALTVAIWTFGEMILFPAMAAHVSDIAPTGRQGEYMGLYTMTFSLAFILGPWLGTVMFEHYGATVSWSATFVLGMISAAVLAITNRTERKPHAVLEDEEPRAVNTT